MGQNSTIAWTTHTFNPWIGCSKVSAGRAHCYAESLMDKRWGKVVWGPNGTRVRTSDANWRQPFKWDREAAKGGERHRVFCASLADVFEDRPELVPWRRELLDTICRTPHLDWLLLTKRPENALRMMVEGGLYAVGNPNLPCPQPNLWIGTSVEDQAAADERIPHLLKVPAAVRFLSCEPLLEEVSIGHALQGACCAACGGYDHGDACIHCDGKGWIGQRDGIHWVIAGAESGPKRRRMETEWAVELREQCRYSEAAFFMKQMDVGGKVTEDIDTFPADLRVRQFPKATVPA